MSTTNLFSYSVIRKFDWADKLYEEGRHGEAEGVRLNALARLPEDKATNDKVVVVAEKKYFFLKKKISFEWIKFNDISLFLLRCNCNNNDDDDACSPQCISRSRKRQLFIFK